jgi:fructose-specific phosphotransferase system IIC component
MPAVPSDPVESGADTAKVKLVGLGTDVTINTPFNALAVFPCTTTVSWGQSPLAAVVFTVATPPVTLAVEIVYGICGSAATHLSTEPVKLDPSMRLPPK